jgi:hypothetical protein
MTENRLKKIKQSPPPPDLRSTPVNYAIPRTFFTIISKSTKVQEGKMGRKKRKCIVGKCRHKGQHVFPLPPEESSE